MSTIFFFGILIIFFIGIPMGIGWFFHWAIKSSGHPRAAKITTILFGLLVLIFGASIYFEDTLFTKEEAIFYVEEQGIELTDDFKLINNESNSAIGYYHTFTLEISEKDKRKAISEIKESDNFQSEDGSTIRFIYRTIDILGLRCLKTMKLNSPSSGSTLSQVDKKDMLPRLEEFQLVKPKMNWFLKILMNKKRPTTTYHQWLERK